MQIKDLVEILNNSSHLFFPKICLHCKEKDLSNNFFCSSCINYFDFLSPSLAVTSLSVLEKTILLTETFEEIGPAKTLLFEMKREGMFHLYKLAASFMVYQYLSLNSPLPDFVVPIFAEEKNIEILSKEVAKILNKPFLKLFYKINIGFWQTFFIKKTALQRKKILLICDTFSDEKKKSILLLLKDGFRDISILAFGKNPKC